MAKSRSSNQGGRGISNTANHRLPRPIAIPSPSNTILTEIEDRRSFYPDDFRPALDIGGRSHTLVIHTPKKRKHRDPMRSLRAFPTHKVQFNRPDQVVLCVRRKRRKEVLHALKKTGRGKGKQRRPRRSWHSQISC